MAAKPSLLQHINADFETAPVVEKGPNVFTTQEYMRAVNIGASTAQRRINDLLRRGQVRAVTVKQPIGLRRGYEFIGDD